MRNIHINTISEMNFDFEIPCEIICKIVEFIDDFKSFLVLSSVCKDFLNAVKDMRLSIIIEQVYRKSKLSLEYIESRKSTEIDMEILKGPLQIYGSLYATKIFMHFNLLAQQPLMLNPGFISSVRNNQKIWESITKKYARIMGYIMEFDNKWCSWYHNKLSHPDRIEGTLKLLKELLAINYLATHYLDKETLLKEVVQQSPIHLVKQLIFEFKDGKVVYHKKTMKALIDELCMNLPLMAKALHRYYNMREMQYYLMEEVFKNLQDEDLIDSDAINPNLGGYNHWTLE